MNTVLRDEWGFRGMVITDFVTSDSKNADRAIRSGTDLSLTTLGNLTPSSLSTDTAAGFFLKKGDNNTAGRGMTADFRSKQHYICKFFRR